MNFERRQKMSQHKKTSNQFALSFGCPHSLRGPEFVSRVSSEIHVTTGSSHVD